MLGYEIYGYASVFNIQDSQSDVITPGAFANNANSSSAKLLWQHDSHQPIGVVSCLHEDDYGLFMRAYINNKTQLGNDVISLIEQKAVSGLSIGFKPIDTYVNNSGLRVITKLDLWEISIVTFPANHLAKLQYNQLG